jgi:hypothetical protein
MKQQTDYSCRSENKLVNRILCSYLSKITVRLPLALSPKFVMFSSLISNVVSLRHDVIYIFFCFIGVSKGELVLRTVVILTLRCSESSVSSSIMASPRIHFNNEPTGLCCMLIIPSAAGRGIFHENVLRSVCKWE